MDTKFGLTITGTPFHGVEKLPLYIIGNYDITQADVNGCACLLLAPVDNLATAATLNKHLSVAEKITQLPAALDLEEITSFRRDSLVKNNIPFISDNQVFLPFMGAFLAKQSDRDYEIEKFSIATQLALIRWFMDPVPEIKVSALVAGLGYTPMTASRVAKQLEATGAFAAHKDGAAKVLSAKTDAKQTFNEVRQYMFSPVAAGGYLNIATDARLYVAGEDAVAERTTLDQGDVRTFAAYGIDKTKIEKELVDSEWQAYVELWRYDPGLVLWKDGMADPVSVALTLSDNEDERIVGAVRDMLDEFWKRTSSGT